MRLTNIQVQDFLGVRDVDVKLRGQIALFCGPNASGKSGIRDAVILALAGDLGRVQLVKEASRLIREGAPSAFCCVSTDSTGEWGVTITGAGTIKDTRKGHDRNPVLPFVLNAQRFSGLTPTDRRAFLYELMGVKTDQGDIARRLEARGCHIGKAGAILSLLRGGIDLAAESAKTKATEARVLWRGVTGEAWGSEKAKTWRAPAGQFDSTELKRCETAIKHADTALANWQQELGRIRGVVQARAALRARLPGLEQAAAEIPLIEAALAQNTRVLSDWEDDLQKTQAAAGVAPREGLVHDLAAALVALFGAVKQTIEADIIELVNASLEAYERKHGPVAKIEGEGDERSRARLPDVLRSRDQAAALVEKQQRELAAAQAAKSELDRIKAELAMPDESEARGSVAQDSITRIQGERAAFAAKAEQLRAAQRAAETADDKTKAAGEHAVDVAEWDAIAKALSPDGIPAELLAAAIDPINGRLMQSAVDTEWAPVVIQPDMTITYGRRDYRLLSESEQWRCDAMLAEAVANVSGVQLLVLDRMDVLDLPGRSALIGWLQVLADQDELDTALLFATLKAPPALEGVQVEWLDDGAIAQQKEAA